MTRYASPGFLLRGSGQAGRKGEELAREGLSEAGSREGAQNPAGF